jgi:hypothetical protein
LTHTPTATNTPIGDPVCSATSEVAAGALTQSGNSLLLDLTNNSGGTVTLDAMHIVWNTGTAIRILDQFLDINQIGNANELSSPSDFPSPNPFIGTIDRREISDTVTAQLVLNFQNPPIGSGYTVQLHFDIGCHILVSQ